MHIASRKAKQSFNAEVKPNPDSKIHVWWISEHLFISRVLINIDLAFPKIKKYKLKHFKNYWELKNWSVAQLKGLVASEPQSQRAPLVEIFVFFGARRLFWEWNTIEFLRH